MTAQLERYSAVAQAASAEVIRRYSTSFGLATKLLSKSHRVQIQNIYALVRVADEIVDGAVAEAKRSGGIIEASHVLDEYEKEVYRALQGRFSSDLIVHSFALTANEVGISRELIRPFFESMRMDLWQTKHDAKSFERYVYGSAEVIGLMCLKVFIAGKPFSQAENREFVEGARGLGAAFQKINFLRDLGADNHGLGRSYFPGITVSKFNNSQRDELVADINLDLAKATASLVKLPADSRKAVSAALSLFRALTQKVAKTEASELVKTRIRVSNAWKAILVLLAILGITPQ